jgi:hypothetical protein
MLLFTASIAIPESAVDMVTTLQTGRPKNRGSNSGMRKKYCAVHITASSGDSVWSEPLLNLAQRYSD